MQPYMGEAINYVTGLSNTKDNLHKITLTLSKNDTILHRDTFHDDAQLTDGQSERANLSGITSDQPTTAENGTYANSVAGKDTSDSYTTSYRGEKVVATNDGFHQNGRFEPPSLFDPDVEVPSLYDTTSKVA